MARSPVAEIVLVGDELLKGERRDAHLPWLARRLADLGVRVARAEVVRDDAGAIADAVRAARSRADVVVVTGGLGPTPDDVTRDGFAAAFDRDLAFDADSWAAIEAFFERYGRTPTEASRRQAMIPRGARALPNTQGTAPGCLLEFDGGLAAMLPGPPRELRPMFTEHVEPVLRERFGAAPLRVETFRTIGIGETDLMARFGEMLEALRAWRVSSLPSITGVDIVLTARDDAPADADAEGELERVHAALRDGLGTKLYERGPRTLARVVHDRLVERGETLAVAESLTGGMIGAALTDFPGASAYLLADVVAYANEAKVELLGVSRDDLAAHGAVSEPVAAAMAHGARRRTGATWGVSTTGIAGPTGATPTKPVGLVYLGVAWEDGTDVRRVRYRGDRDVVRERAVHGALWMLFDRIAREGGGS